MARTVTAHALASALSILLLSACGGGGGGSGGDNPPPATQNQPPVAAVAGPEKEAAFAGEPVTLDAGSTSDADGSIAGVLWEQVDGPSVEIADSTAIVLKFIAPAVSKDTEIAFRLVVTDDDGATSTEEVRLLIHAVLPGNQSPDAITSGNLVVRGGDEVTLDARGSTDADGRITSYAWTQIDGESVVIGEAAGAVAGFTAPSGEDELVFRVVVTDDAGATDSDVVRVRVAAANANQPPLANIAELANGVSEGAGFSLDGGTSTDPENAALTFHWTVPAGFAVDGDTANRSRLQLTDTPDVTNDASYTFILVVSDGQFTASTAVDVIVEAINHPPAVAIQTTPQGLPQTGLAEGASATLRAVATDSDGHTISYSWQQLDGDETLDLAGVTGPELVFAAPDVGLAGDRYAFQVTAEDTEGASTPATIAFNVNFVNREPVAMLVADRTEAAEGTTVVLDATGSSDPDGQTLSFTWSEIKVNGMPDADIADHGNGTATVTMPDISPAQDGGLLRFRVTVNDGHNAPNSEKFAEVDVTAHFINQLPELTSISASHSTVDEGDLEPDVTLTVDAFDPDGSALDYEWQVPDVGFVASGRQSATLTLTRTPDVAATGPHTFTVNVSDGIGSSAFQIPIRVNFVNREPVANAGPALTIPEDADLEATEFRLDGSGSRDGDVEVGHQQLTYTWRVPVDSGLVLDDANAVSPRIVAVPDVTAPGAEPITVTLEVSDGIVTKTAATSVEVVFVNQPPVIDDIEGPSSIPEGEGFELVASGHDDDEGVLRYEWTLPAGFQIAPDSAASSVLVITGTPDVTAADAENGITRDFSVIVVDAQGVSSAPRVHPVTITFLNQAPVIENVSGDHAVNEQTGGHVLAANGEDGDGQPLTYTWTLVAAEPPELMNADLGVAFPFVGATLTYTAPDVSQDGARIVFAVTVNDTVDDSAPFEFPVAIDKDGVLPVIDTITPAAVSIPEGAGHAFTITVEATDNFDADALEYFWTPAAGFATRVDADAPNVLVIEATPDVGPAGDDYAFRIDVTDTDGNTTGQTFTVPVDFVNRQPVINAVTVPANAVEGSTVTLAVNANDDDTGHPTDAQALVYSWEETTEADVDLVVDVNGTATFTAPTVGPEDNVVLRFEVTVNDQSGAENATATSEPRDIAITFDNVRPEITAAGSNSPVDEGNDVQLTVTAFDQDGQELTYAWTQSEEDLQQIDPAAITGANTANASFVAPDFDEPTPLNFTITVSDGELSIGQPVQVTIQPVNDFPVIESIAQSADAVPEGDLDPDVTFTVAANDIDSPTLSYRWTVPAAFSEPGMVSGTDSAQLIIHRTPDVTAQESYTFSVEVNDNEGGVTQNDPADPITLTVNAVNQAPEISLAAAESPVNESDSVTLTVGATDADGHPLTYTWEQVVAEGEVPVIEPISGAIDADGNGEATFTAPDVEGVDFVNLDFTVTVDDGNGGTDTSDVVTVVVNRVNENPSNIQISPATAVIDEGPIPGEGLTFVATAEDDAPPADGLRYTWSGLEGFTYTGDTTSTLTITATPNVTPETPQPCQLTVTVEDGEGGVATKTASLTVNFVNQSPLVSIDSAEITDGGTVNENSGTITLIANGSDADGTAPTSYTWRQTDASGTRLFEDGVSGSQLSFPIPTVTGDTDFIVEVTATDVDDPAVTATDSIDFRVLNTGDQPSVSITPAISEVFSGFEINLTAVTSELGGDITYAWSQIDGSGTSLGIVDETSSSLSIVAPDVTGEVPVTVQVEAAGEANGAPTTVSDQLSFTIKQRPADVPLPFTFVDLNPVPVGRVAGQGLKFDSNAVVIDGLDDDGAVISITGGEYKLNDDPGFTSDPGTISNGDRVTVRLTGPSGDAGDGAIAEATLTVGDESTGSYSDTFSVRGEAATFEPTGIPGGLRWTWQAMQGTGELRIYRANGSVSAGTRIGTLPGDATAFEDHRSVLEHTWQGTNADRYDLRAVDAENNERDVLGSRRFLQQTDSVDAITYFKHREAGPALGGAAFGSALAVSNDGRLMVVGAPGDGANEGERQGRVYVYRRVDEAWEYLQTLSGQNNDDYFGAAVALTGDGQILAVGAPGYNIDVAQDAGEVYVYRYRDDETGFDTSVESVTTLRPTGGTSVAGDDFGSSLAILGYDGNQDGTADVTLLGVGVPNDDRSATGADDDALSDSGAVYIYSDADGSWAEKALLKENEPGANNRFGTAVALANTVVNGFQVPRLFASRTGNDQRIVYIRDSYSLEAGATWENPSNGLPGAVVNESSPAFGDVLSVGRTGFPGRRFVSGTTMYTVSGSLWAQRDVRTFSPVPIGSVTSVALSPNGQFLAVGTAGDGVPGGAGAFDQLPAGSDGNGGAVYVYYSPSVSGGVFRKYLRTPNPDAEDAFGSCMAFDMSALIPRLYACAPGEDSAGTNVHPVSPIDMRDDNSAGDSGAVYVY